MMLFVGVMLGSIVMNYWVFPSSDWAAHIGYTAEGAAAMLLGQLVIEIGRIKGWKFF